MSKKTTTRKPSRHDAVTTALIRSSFEYKHAMNANNWLRVIQDDLYDKFGFHPTINQVRYALKKLAKSNMFLSYYHERGWYRYYTYKANPEQVPF